MSLTHGVCSPPHGQTLPSLRCEYASVNPDISSPSAHQHNYSDHYVAVSTLVDSGSSGIFISQELLNLLNLPCRCQARELRVETIQEKPLGRGQIKYQAPLMMLQIGCLHKETITLMVMEGPTVDIILGCPWLNQHFPEIRWDPCEVTRWSEAFHQNCLSTGPVKTQACSTLVDSRLLHSRWDCAIDLLPGATLPKCRVYSLSFPEHKAMEEYIPEVLQRGSIQHSTSPVTSSFFFVEKKEGGLRPCIDYRALNLQTVKFPYPLPLLPAALEELCGACIFTKVDMWSTYFLVYIWQGNEWKMAFIRPLRIPGDAVWPSQLPVRLPWFVYIDYILLYSQNLAKHRRYVKQVLKKFRKYYLYLA